MPKPFLLFFNSWKSGSPARSYASTFFFSIEIQSVLVQICRCFLHGEMPVVLRSFPLPASYPHIAYPSGNVPNFPSAPSTPALGT